jgi:ubiquinone/menaquinone biosynthesis C-methylase UbiE
MKGVVMPNLFDPLNSKSTYVIDTESAPEMARLIMQDRLLTQKMGGIWAEQMDVSEIQDVLDIASGPGAWAIEVANTYQQKQVIGIDISQTMTRYARAQADSLELDNISFKVMDITEPLAFPDASFDLVNARLLSGVLQRHVWSDLLRECVRILRPGGILRVTEGDIPVTNSLACETVYSWLAQALHKGGYGFSVNGHQIGLVMMLEKLVRTAGLEQTQSRAHSITIASDSPELQNVYDNISALSVLLLPFITGQGVVGEEEFTATFQRALSDMQTAEHLSIGFHLTVWGKKALATDDK